MLMRSGVVELTQLPARTLVLSRSNGETSKFTREMWAGGQTVVVANDKNYPVLDFAAILYTGFIAEVGNENPRVNAGAFITLMLYLELAEEINGRLVMKDEHKNSKIALTMLRNSDKSEAQETDVLELHTDSNHQDLDLKQI